MKKLSVMLPVFLVVMALAIPSDAGAVQRPGDETFRTSALVAPTLRSPGSGTLLQNMGAITLSFELPSGSTQYHLQVTPYRGDGPGVNLIRNAETSFTLQPPTLGIGPYVMLPGMTYTWRIRGTDATISISDTSPLWGDWSDEWSFTTPPPSSASIRPQDPPLGAMVTSLTPTLTWADDNPYIFYYEIQVSKDILFDTNPFTAVASVYMNFVHGGESRPFNSWAVPGSYPLEQKCRYYWRVRPRVQGNGTPVNWGQSFWFDAPARPGVECNEATGTPDVTPTPTATATPTATPTPSSYTLVVTKAGTGSGTVTSLPVGINCGIDCSEMYSTLGPVVVVTLTASPLGGSTFAGWSGDPDCSDGTVIMNSDKICTAIFQVGTDTQTPTLMVNKGGSGNGTVTSSPPGINCGIDCSEPFQTGTVVSLTAISSSGSTFSGWSGDPDCTDGQVTMNTSKSCTALFEATAAPTSTPTPLPTRTPTPTMTSTPSSTPTRTATFTATATPVPDTIGPDGNTVYWNAGPITVPPCINAGTQPVSLSMTFEASVKLTAPSGVIGAQLAGGGNEGGSNKWSFESRDGLIAMQIWGRPGTGGIIFKTNKNISDGAWHHVAFTYNNNGVPTFWVDGSSAPITGTENGNAAEGSWNPTPTTLEVGCSEGQHGRLYADLKNIRLSNIVRSSFPMSTQVMPTGEHSGFLSWIKALFAPVSG